MSPVSIGGAGGRVPLSLPTSGWYSFTTPANATTSASFGNGNLRLAPVLLPRALAITRIGMEVTSAGDADSTFILGVYADTGGFQPGALLLDTSVSGSDSTVLSNGKISGASATVQEITVAYTVPAGLSWWGAALQGVTVTQPTVRIADPSYAPNFMVPVSASIPGSGTAPPQGWVTGSVTAALPATAGNDGNTSTIMPRLFYKAA